MLKINNEGGITLIALIITIVVLLILSSIIINYGISNIQNVINNQIDIELSTIQNAVIQQYSVAKTRGKLNIIVDNENEEEKPECFVGTIIYDFNELKNYNFENLIEYDDTKDMYYENYYYSLNYKDLEELGIEEPKNNEGEQNVLYIVNYATGEIYDVKNKEYLEGTNDKIKEEYNFIDEIEEDGFTDE